MKRIKQFIPYKSAVKKFVLGIANSFRYYFSSNSLNPIFLSSVSRIHFVCTGNICRSVFAEKLAHRKLREQNLAIEVVSSGIQADQGNRSPDIAVIQAKHWDIDLSGHIPNKISEDKIDETTLLLGMHYSHYEQLNSMYPHYKNTIYLLKHFATNKFFFIDIHDPYNCPDHVFYRCFSEIEACIDGLISKLNMFR